MIPIHEALRPPAWDEIAVPQSVKDWLDPNGTKMSGKSVDEVRREVAQDLATRMGNGSYFDEVIGWLEVWVSKQTTPLYGGTARNAELVALQLEAQQIFGGNIDHLASDANRQDVVRIRQRKGDFIRDLLSAMYDSSQESLAEHGIKMMTLWRGEKGIINPKLVEGLGQNKIAVGIGTLPFQPISSFTHHREQALRFTRSPGSLIVVAAPASRILATPATGFGLLQQREEVILALPSSVGIEDRGLVAVWLDEKGQKIVDELRESDWIHLIRNSPGLKE